MDTHARRPSDHPRLILLSFYHLDPYEMWRTTCHCVNAMDIARPEFKRQKLRRQILLAASGIVAIAALTVGVTRLRPAAPSVERGAVWTDTVKHGSMLRQVRGPGPSGCTHR